MRRKLSAFIALTTTTACTSWQVQPGPTPSVVQTAREHSVQPLRLNMNSGASVEIYEATVVDDSIVGMNGPSTQASRRCIMNWRMPWRRFQAACRRPSPRARRCCSSSPEMNRGDN